MTGNKRNGPSADKPFLTAQKDACVLQSAARTYRYHLNSGIQNSVHFHLCGLLSFKFS